MKILKSFVAAAALATVASGAMAAPTFSILGGTSTSYAGNNYAPLPAAEFGSSFLKTGTLMLSEAGVVTFSFVSKEAGYNNSFEAFYVGSTKIWGSGGPLQSFTVVVENPGALSFAYLSNGGGVPIGNGGTGMGADVSSLNPNRALIVFNDNGSLDQDYDDLTISAVVAVPEAETYAMMLAGLGLMGAIARRRNKAKTA